MPVITINDKQSPAFGKTAFWFDTKKPRHAPGGEKKKSLDRLNLHRVLNGEKRLKPSDIQSYEHLSADRSIPDSLQLFACTSQEQHTNIELQKIELFSTLFKMGKIGFDYCSKKFFVACEALEKDIKHWQSQGSPLNWNIVSKKRAA